MKLLISILIFIFLITSCAKKDIFVNPFRTTRCYNKGDQYDLIESSLHFHSKETEVLSIISGKVKVVKPLNESEYNESFVVIENSKYRVKYYKIPNFHFEVDDSLKQGDVIGEREKINSAFTIDIEKTKKRKDIGKIKYFTCDTIPRCRDLKK